MDLFFELHKDLPREGPGDNASTARAFAMIPGLPPRPRILDIGCGPGKQTFVLAARSGGHVTALDKHRPFLDELTRLVSQAGLARRIAPLEGDMAALDFADESFDLLWSEGAIYILGFERGLREWKRLLKPGGGLAVTEISWLVENPPAEALAFWGREYPQMKSVAENLEIVERCGYRLLDHFTLPQSAWWEQYYTPMEVRLEMLRAQNAANPEALRLLDESQAEIDLYRKFSDAYGYEFYVMQKNRE